jgi:hypothetical protein
MAVPNGTPEADIEQHASAEATSSDGAPPQSHLVRL